MKHVWKKLMAAMLALTLLLSVTGAVAEEAETVYGVCTGDEVRVRKTAGTSGKLWFEVNKGHVAEILGTQTVNGDIWYKINSPHPIPNGRTYIGYIMEDYFRPMTEEETEAYLLENAAPGTSEDTTPDSDEPAEDTEHVEYNGVAVTGAVGKVTANTNFRSQPTTKAGEVLAIIPKGTEVEVTAIPEEGDTTGWYRVRYDGQPGYVYCDLLEIIEAGTIVPNDPDDGTEVTGAKGVVTADGVNFRMSDSTDSVIISELDEGTEVELLTIPDQISVNDWYRVRYNGQVGYIQSNFIRVTDSGDLEDAEAIGTGKVTGNNVNFRTGPGTGYTIIGKLAAGTEVELLVIPAKVDSSHWYQVRYNGETGYIQSTYIQVLTQDGVIPDDEVDNSDVVSTGITTSASGVNFRIGPGTDYSTYGKLGEGTVVELLSIPEVIDEDHWYKIRYNNKTGYIQAPFIRVLTINENDLPEVTKYGYARLIKDVNVHLRETPGGTIITKWSGKGSLMRIVGEPVSKGMHSWYPVYHVAHATIYYVRDDMIEVVVIKDGEIVTPTPEPESPYGYVITTAPGVNLRIKPGKDYITQIPRNTVLTCVGPVQSPSESKTSYYWYEVKYNGMTGFVRGDFVRVCTSTGGEISDLPDSEPTEDPSQSTTIYGYVKITTKTGSRVHLRDEPQGNSLTMLPHGLILPVMGQPRPAGMYGEYIWYPVRTADGLNGYIRSDLLTLCDANGNKVEETPAPGPSDEPELVGATGKILTNTNFRTGASTDSAIITVIPAKTVVKVLSIPADTKNGWYKIFYNGEKGYVYATLIEMISMGGEDDGSDEEDTTPSAFGYVMITGNGLNVRKTPGGTVVTQVNSGSVWPIIGATITRDGDDWFNIIVDGEEGYVHSDYAYKLSPEQEESYLAGNGVPEITPPPEVVPSNYLITTGSTLNVRESYSQDSTSVYKVPRGTVLEFFDTKTVGTATWYSVLCNHLELWVHGNYVDEMTVAEYQEWAAENPDLVPNVNDHLGYLKTNQSNAYLRNAADGSTRVGKIATKGTVMRYYAELIPAGGYNWYRVLSPEGQFAYIRSDLVEKCDENGDPLPIPTPDLGDLTSAPQMQQETEYTTLKLTSKGTKVTNLVQELINQGYYKGPVTDTYTSDVKAAVEAFQSVKGLYVNGIANSATQHALFGTVPLGAGNTGNLDFTIYPVEKIDWFTGGIQDMIPRGSNFKVYDLKTGIVWWAHRWAGAYHADIETLTAADTARLCEIYGVDDAQDIYDDNKWQRRPCLVTIGTRTFACSLDGMPHNPDGDTISNNNMTGQICLHFTNSTSHGDPPIVSTTHAEAIEYAYNNCPAGQKK